MLPIYKIFYCAIFRYIALYFITFFHIIFIYIPLISRRMNYMQEFLYYCRNIENIDQAN